MHQLLTAFFAFLFSFGHAQAAHQVEADQFVPPAQYAADTSGIDYAVPSHQQIIDGQYNVTAASYAEGSCNGCQLTTVSYDAR